jgi:hypothetical protein
MMLKTKAMIKIYFSFLSIFTIMSCQSNQGTTQNTSVNTAEKTSSQDIDGIAFLIFKINKNKTNNKTVVSFIKNIKTEGALKGNLNELINSDNTLIIEIFRNGVLDQNIVINHPLYKNVEYTTANKTFLRKEITIDEAEFSIRITNKASKTTIKIFEILKNNTKKELNTFNL